MVQFTPGTGSSMPSSVTTVEAVAVWAITVLQTLYPDLKTVEALNEDGEPVEVRTVEGNTFYISASDPARWRYLARLSVELRKEFPYTGKLWENVKILGDDAIPSALKS